MPYSITGLVVRSSEVVSSELDDLPKVSLNLGFSLIPMTHEHILLTEGDDTDAKADFPYEVPKWLSDIAGRFTSSAYIEAAIFGGVGMQPSISFSKDSVEALISSRAINYALRNLGVDYEKSGQGLFGWPHSYGKDPFEMLGLDRFREVEDWLNAAP